MNITNPDINEFLNPLLKKGLKIYKADLFRQPFYGLHIEEVADLWEEINKKRPSLRQISKVMHKLDFNRQQIFRNKLSINTLWYSPLLTESILKIKKSKKIKLKIIKIRRPKVIPELPEEIGIPV